MLLPLLLNLPSVLGSPLYAREQDGGQVYSVSRDQPGQCGAVKDEAPVAMSVEFYQFPAWKDDTPAFSQCLAFLGDAAGAPTRVRIGGTSEDRAHYDPNLNVSISWPGIDDAIQGPLPVSVTYGPKFFQLAGALSGPVSVGLNRADYDLENVKQALLAGIEYMPNLYSFELGNEPDVYLRTDADAPLLQGRNWSIVADAETQAEWQQSIIDDVGPRELFSSGGYYFVDQGWTIQNLTRLLEEQFTTDYIRTFSNHAYPQTGCGGIVGNLSALQSHADVVSFVGERFKGEPEAAMRVGKEIVFSETNSASCGGGGVSPTFGAALWTVDYVLQAVLNGYSRLHFHLGNPDGTAYNWFDTDRVNAPFYGALFASKALKGMASIKQLDDGSSRYAVYALSAGCCDTAEPSRVVLYNSDFFSSNSTGARPTKNFELTGIKSDSVSLLKLTAPFSDGTVEGGVVTTIGQQSLGGGCSLDGDYVKEQVRVNNGRATIEVSASEAVLVYL